jgi:hypothetical protein
MKRTPLRRTAFRRKPPTEHMNQDVRDAVMKRDAWRCQARVRGYAPEVECRGALHAHHAVLRSQGGQDTLEHMLAVCMAHHDHLHNVDRAGAEAYGLIRRLH